MSKQYGLIIPNKGKQHLVQAPIARPSIFDNDSDSDAPPPSLKPTGLGKIRKQDKLNQNKALEEDPTVYQYDEVYDVMEQSRKESKLARKDLDKKPKYITKLLAAAERRKRENERRIERQVQKEREAEGEEFNDKESFVTTAYKKKLEEMKELEEQEKREEYLESIGDVTKQGNLDGFYRHLYHQKVNYDDDKVKEEPKSDSDENKRKLSEYESDEDIKPAKKNRQSAKRNYRTRKQSEKELEDDEEPVTVKKEHLPSNLDADSDFSIDSSDDESEEQKTNNIQENESKEVKETAVEKGNVLGDNMALAKAQEDDDEKKVPDSKEEEIEEKPKRPKIDIWKKRTVGDLFDEAVRRYFERKATRDAFRNG
ncbi:nuclear speckle splicing regulatory protein 1 [Cylas formicarius]|uniref:nuclear speckle splicing regulatory protein 1 n=1 Tax=Cylas formicarius TaxID=197179 RepID=UPI00295875E2|nr:nuclear speckle splicing regulatory protein 1 [Cylas formicarius]